MSQETKDDTIKDSDKKMEKTSSEENSKKANQTNLSDSTYNKGLETAMEQIALFEENVKKLNEAVDIITFSSNLEKLKNCEESTRMTLKAMEGSVRFNIMDPEPLKYLNEIKETYFELNQEAMDVPNVSIVSQSLLLNDIDLKMDAVICVQNAYIENLEKELNKKEDEMRQLRAIIEEKKKKDNIMIE